MKPDSGNRLKQARQALQRAMHGDPDNPIALINRGHILMSQGQWTRAEALFRQALAIEPTHMDAYVALAKGLMKQGDLGPAEVLLEQALDVDAGDLVVHELILQVYSLRSEPFKAHKERLRRALFLDGVTGAKAAFEVAHASLLHGVMPLGWDQFEARFQVPGLIHPERHFTQPRWNGEPFRGKTLLLHFEQGFGDTVMFVRYAPMVKALGGRVLLEAQKPLIGLLATCGGIDDIIPTSQPLPAFDLQLPLLSLPQVFRTDLHSIPADIPYLDVPEEIPNRQRILELLATTQDRTRIGLAWAGSPGHKRDGDRSISPALLAPLAALPDVAWFSFQLEAIEAPPLPGLIALDSSIRNFSDTAYALTGMQLVITVDTALAHLAGALGIPTLLLVSFIPDYRWMLEREDTPWYPTVRIYRQPKPGDWNSVVQRILGDLMGYA